LPGEVITATATDPSGNTSEFSAAIVATEDSQAAGLLIGRRDGRQATVSGTASGASPMSAVLDQVFAHNGARGSVAGRWLGAHTMLSAAPHWSQDSAGPLPWQARLDDPARLIALDLAEILDA